MSTDPTVRDVFRDVEPDPDAILARYDADSPDELVAAGGRHDPTTADDDADDTTSAELFARLVVVSTDPVSG